MGVATNRAKFFIEGASPNRFNQFLEKQNLRQLLLNETKSKWSSLYGEQLSLF